MSALDIAEQHLTEALSRLEQALAQRLSHADPGQAEAVAQLADEREALRTECDRLLTALKTAEGERDNALRMTREVADKLDVSIDELDRLIEE